MTLKTGNPWDHAKKKKSKDDASISYQNGIVFNDLTICILYLTIVGKRYHQYKWVETKAPITDKTTSKTQRYTTLHSLFSLLYI